MLLGLGFLLPSTWNYWEMVGSFKMGLVGSLAVIKDTALRRFVGTWSLSPLCLLSPSHEVEGLPLPQALVAMCFLRMSPKQCSQPGMETFRIVSKIKIFVLISLLSQVFCYSEGKLTCTVSGVYRLANEKYTEEQKKRNSNTKITSGRK